MDFKTRNLSKEKLHRYLRISVNTSPAAYEEKNDKYSTQYIPPPAVPHHQMFQVTNIYCEHKTRQ